MDVYLDLENRVYARMALADMAATGDGDPLTEEGVQLQLTFRDEQLVRLRDEVLDIDELDDIPTMSDFTLDYRPAEVPREEPCQLERTTAHATWSEPCPDGPVWFSSCATARPDRDRDDWPAPIRSTWSTFETTAGSGSAVPTPGRCSKCSKLHRSAGPEAILRLCDVFNAETDNGQDMDRYDKLLTAVVGHVTRAHNRTQIASLGIGASRDSILPRSSETPRAATDFELVTWLVISNPE